MCEYVFTCSENAGLATKVDYFACDESTILADRYDGVEADEMTFNVTLEKTSENMKVRLQTYRDQLDICTIWSRVFVCFSCQSLIPKS